MKISIKYNTTILSSYIIFKNMNNIESIECFKPILFNEVRKEGSTIHAPDYIFKNVQKDILNVENFRELLNNTLESLSNYLYIKNNKLYVKDNHFEEWQYIITKVSPLILISYFIYKNDIKDSFVNQFEYSTLPSIYNKKLDYVIKSNEIVDVHIHLTGTTEVDVVWQDIMQQPKLFLTEMKKSLGNITVNEQYISLDSKLDFKELSDDVYNTINIRKIFIDNLNLDHSNNVVDEMRFFINIFKKINKDKKCFEVQSFWKYILMYNFIYKLLVQQHSQVGFEQFQKITENELREYTEKNYKKRFEQLKTIYNDDFKIEGRFAPKSDSRKMVNLLDSIIKSDDSNGINLSLVGHFIKKVDKRKYNEMFSYRDMLLRVDLKKSSESLCYLIKNNSKYSKYIKGFDAAGNELYARPEVYASSFKYLRSQNIGSFTFHGGEDFLDLMSGIRYIYEIIEFLDFEHGDRIGHATAIGINPKLWKERVGTTIVLSQGEYLDNLIFIYYLLKKGKKYQKYFNTLRDEIQEYCYLVYGENFDIYLLIESWKIRKEDPKIILEWNEKCSDYKKRYSTSAINIYKQYHSDSETLENYFKLISVDTNYLKNKVIIYLQNIVIDKLNTKNIIIETMLTSNTRISFYNSYKEHHISRWLGFGKAKNYPKPILVIASDDPGIFATNIRNEITHLYLILKKFAKNEDEIFGIINNILINNKIYSF